METLLLFIAGILFTWPALIALFVLGLLFEHSAWRGTAIFFGLLLAVSGAFYFTGTSITALPPFSLALLGTALMYIGGYLAIGVPCSFYRYKRHANKIVKTNRNCSKEQKEHALARLHPSEMGATLVAWIFIWPFAMLDNIIGDLIDVVEMLVKKVFRGAYNRIYEAAAAALLGATR